MGEDAKPRAPATGSSRTRLVSGRAVGCSCLTVLGPFRGCLCLNSGGRFDRLLCRFCGWLCGSGRLPFGFAKAAGFASCDVKQGAKVFRFGGVKALRGLSGLSQAFSDRVDWRWREIAHFGCFLLKTGPIGQLQLKQLIVCISLISSCEFRYSAFLVFMAQLDWAIQSNRQ